MLISEFLDTVWREISVKGCPANIKLIDHIPNEGIIFRIFKQGFGLLDRLLIHGLWPTTPSSTLIGRRKTGASILDNQLPLEFIPKTFVL